jgi:hypothetical protein
MSAILTVLVRIDRMNVKRYETGIFHPVYFILTIIHPYYWRSPGGLTTAGL